MEYPFLAYEKSNVWTDRTAVPDLSGVYAIFLKTTDNLPHEWQAQLKHKDHLFYIGKSAMGLGKRLTTHFEGDDSSSDTFRKSVGAILRQQLSLRLINLKADKKKWRFEDHSEFLLSKWIQKNCLYTTLSVEDTEELEELEKRLIEHYCPPLNIKNNPCRSEVLRQARAECRSLSWHT